MKYGDDKLLFASRNVKCFQCLVSNKGEIKEKWDLTAYYCSCKDNTFHWKVKGSDRQI